MNTSTRHPHRRRHLRPAVRRLLTVTAAACLAVGGISFALSRSAALPQAASIPARSAASQAEDSAAQAQQAQAMLDDPRMVLVNHTNKMPDGYTFTTKECGSATADAFLAMQAAAAKDGVTVWMQSGYRSVDYQKNLYDKKTQYFLEKGLSRDEALKQAATIVNPPGYSEHNCGLAADLNSPEHTGLDEGFENTEAFRWLCAHAEEYGFILRYPKDAEAVTEITYEPWHWRYVGPENAALINQSGLCFEDAVALLKKLAAGESVTG
jgi:D-alanyl-D-alanine carboxypeptidase